MAEPPLPFALYKAVALADAADGRQSGPKRIIMKLHVLWGHASAQNLKRVLADSDGGNMH